MNQAFAAACRSFLPGILSEAEWQVFFDSLSGPASVSVRLNPSKTAAFWSPKNGNPVPWCPEGYFLKERPFFTGDPMFHGGAYYVQEASSMFVGYVLKQVLPELPDAPLCLDLCAAPGGKSTHLLSVLPESALLVCNETIAGRIAPLKENLTRWGKANVVITRNDSTDFLPFENGFDLILADAPCSGEGLFRKMPDYLNEWSPQTVTHCAGRQQRILSDAARLVKPGGFLVYSTCTFNPQENEDQIRTLTADGDWLPVPVQVPEEWNLVETRTESLGLTFSSWRFFPHRTGGEGFFLTILQKAGGPAVGIFPKGKFQWEFPAKAVRTELEEKIGFDLDWSVLQFPSGLRLFPAYWQETFAALQSRLRTVAVGVEAGTFKGKDFIPAHDLALSHFRLPGFLEKKLSLQEAGLYLQKENFETGLSGASGFFAVSQGGIRLGWAKQLTNRMNNYLPSEYRIKSKVSEKDFFNLLSENE